jgi:hypothetical protein
MFGINVKNPTDMIKKVRSAMILIADTFSDFHKNIPINGDKINKTEGDPNKPCNFNGKGNNAAPHIEKEKVRIKNIGRVFNPTVLPVL